MTENVETTDTAAGVSSPQGDEPEEEQVVPPKPNADYLQADDLTLCDHTSEQCFAVRRRTIARPTYSLPAVARLHMLAEVIGNPSGLLECQWKIADVVAESVNALEQRLLQVADADCSEDETDSTGVLCPVA